MFVCVQEMLERLEAHLKAEDFYTVTGNMSGTDPEEISRRLLNTPGLEGLAGPTIAPVYRGKAGGGVTLDTYAASISVAKEQLYGAVKALRKAGGSGVLVSPMTYIFDEEPERWTKLLATLGKQGGDVPNL